MGSVFRMKLVMLKILKPRNPIHLFILAMLLGSLAIVSIFVFANIEQSIPPALKISDEDRNEDIVLFFLSPKTCYKPGENAIFYMNMYSLRDFSVLQIDFSLEIKPSTLVNSIFLSLESSTYKPSFSHSGSFEITLPKYVPAGAYILELSAKTPISENPAKVTISIYIESSTLLIPRFLIASIILCAIYVLVTAPPFERSIPYSAIRRAYLKFSIGQKLIFSGVFALIVAYYPLMLGLEKLVNNVVALAYFSIMIGVINLIWERMKFRISSLKLPPPIRGILSLFILGDLIYFASKFLAVIIFVFIFILILKKDKQFRTRSRINHQSMI